jgi:DNA modification methylase
LVKKIEDLNEFWAVLKNTKSFYARHRMYPPPFSWTLRTIDAWIKAGYFWTVAPCGKPKREFPVK